MIPIYRSVLGVADPSKVLSIFSNFHFLVFFWNFDSLFLGIWPDWTGPTGTGPTRTGPDRSDIRGAKASHHGSWIKDHESWIMDQRSTIKDQWSSINDHGSRIMDQVSSIKYQVSRIKDQGSRTLDLAWMPILDGIPTWDQDHPNLLWKIYHFI